VTDHLVTLLTGVIATSSLVAALFFLRFWSRTRDRFFLVFALAFAIDGASRLLLGAIRLPNEFEPYTYLPRLLTFSLIIAAVVLKNRS
jgi:hypothetical protein